MPWRMRPLQAATGSTDDTAPGTPGLKVCAELLCDWFPFVAIVNETEFHAREEGAPLCLLS